MTTTNFSFLLIFLLLLAISPLLLQIPTSVQELCATGLLLFWGIPHGAIDHVLYLENTQRAPFYFYAWYLGAIAVNALLWFWIPAIAFSGFLAISAYHFGQSQFAQLFQTAWKWSGALYFFWGASVICAFTWFNLEDLNQLARTQADLAPFQVLLHPFWVGFFFITGISGAAILGIAACRAGHLPKQSLALETYNLILILVVAALTDFIIGFMLYFTILHAFKVMQAEYRHFYPRTNLKTLWGFTRKLLPFSLVSYFGILLLFGIIYLGYAPISYPFALLLAISSITLPHVFVMERFYGNTRGLND